MNLDGSRVLSKLTQTNGRIHTLASEAEGTDCAPLWQRHTPHPAEIIHMHRVAERRALDLTRASGLVDAVHDDEARQLRQDTWFTRFTRQLRQCLHGLHGRLLDSAAAQHVASKWPIRWHHERSLGWQCILARLRTSASHAGQQVMSLPFTTYRAGEEAIARVDCREQQREMQRCRLQVWDGLVIAELFGWMA